MARAIAALVAGSLILIGATPSAAFASDPAPSSALGCNGAVCVYVDGSGSFVTSVYAYANYAFTGHFRIYDDKAGWSSSTTNRSWLHWDWFKINPNSNQPVGSQMCATAYSTSGAILGNACETIEK